MANDRMQMTNLRIADGEWRMLNPIVIASPASRSYTLSNLTRGVAISQFGDAMTGKSEYIQLLIDMLNTGLSDRFVSRLGDCHPDYTSGQAVRLIVGVNAITIRADS